MLICLSSAGDLLHVAVALILFQGEFEKAEDELIQVTHLDESYVSAKYFLALVLIQQRKYTMAVSILESALFVSDLTDPALLSAMALAHGRNGNRYAFDVTVRELENASLRGRVDPFFRAFALLDFDPPRAINLLRQAYE